MNASMTDRTTQQDDWAAQVSRMRRAALAWRLSRLLQQQQQGPEGGGGEGDAMEVVAGNGAGEKGKKR